MKFSIFQWHEVKPNEKIAAPKGRLRVQCSAPAPLYAEAEGYEVLVQVGQDFDLALEEAVIWRVDAPKGARVFWQPPEITSFVPQGEVFTNIDRLPQESGQVAEITRALRELELERRAILREIRDERAALDAARGVTVAPPEPPAPPVEPHEPAVEAAP